MRVDVDQPLENADWPKARYAQLTAAFDPSKHPREPAGTRVGGRWAKKTGAAWAGPKLTPDPDLVDEVAATWEGPSRWGTDANGEEFYGPDPIPQALLHGMTDAEYMEAVEVRTREWLEPAYVATRVPAPLLDEILKDGRLKSQFETGGSRGTFSNDGRRYSEFRMFGYEGTLPDEQRPIYGYMKSPHRSVPWVGSYGDVELEMKWEMRDRSTFTDGDSYAQGLIPSPVNDPSYLSTDSTYGNDPMGGIGSGWYVEAQMHGGVSLDDVAAAHVPYDWDPKNDNITGWYSTEKAREIKAALAALEARGIPVEYDLEQA